MSLHPNHMIKCVSCRKEARLQLISLWLSMGLTYTCAIFKTTKHHQTLHQFCGSLYVTTLLLLHLSWMVNLSAAHSWLQHEDGEAHEGLNLIMGRLGKLHGTSTVWGSGRTKCQINEGIHSCVNLWICLANLFLSLWRTEGVGQIWGRKSWCVDGDMGHGNPMRMGMWVQLPSSWFHKLSL